MPHIVRLLVLGCLFLLPVIDFGTASPLPVRQLDLSKRDCTFAGNPDIYGLGIRLGLYLQWTASMLTCALLDQQAYVPHDAPLLILPGCRLSRYQKVC